ncbi:protein kinase [Streptomyces sp. NPDC014006]|uniref:protein kinase domain-containing protein n=1 Tax=Streptomyces sp. NPDC014006 TaxID=3364870 RepID=UPI00370306CD
MKPLESSDPRSVGGDRYRLIGRLGQGGMGVVYLGRSQSGRAVAVKVVRPELSTDPDFLRRFAREITAARQVGGFHTAPVVDADPDGNPAWLVTAYVPGPTLHRVLKRVGSLPAYSLTVLAAGLAEALEAIHRVGVAHRDLKPANIIVAEDGPRVIDFGIARALDGTPALTQTGFQVGTPGYLAPEQLTGGAITAAVDMFALGVVLCQAAGGSPFGDGSTAGWLYRVVHEEPDLAAVPPMLREAVAACLAKDPLQRPTPSEFLAGLTVLRREDGGWLPDAAMHLLTPQEVPGAQAPAPPGHDDAQRAPASPTVADPGPDPSGTHAFPRADSAAPTPRTAPAAEETAASPTVSALSSPPRVREGDQSADAQGPRARRRPWKGSAVAAALVVCTVAAAVLVWQTQDDGSPNKAQPKQSVKIAPPSGPAAFPTAPLLVRLDTAPGWPSTCHGVIALRPAATDEPRRVVHGGTCDILPQWAPDRRSFAFTRITSGDTAVWTANADGSGARRIASIAGGRVSWSPDGTRLAVLRKQDGVQQLFVVRVSDGSSRRITTGTGRVEDPAWSPDGSRIAVSYETSPGNWQIHVVEPDARQPELVQVTRLPHPAVDAVWSPDGKTFAYTAGSYNSGRKGDIHLVRTDGTGDRALVATPEHEMDPAWSADGTWVAFVRGPYQTPVIWAVRADGTGERRLTTGSSAEGHPAWQ